VAVGMRQEEMFGEKRFYLGLPTLESYVFMSTTTKPFSPKQVGVGYTRDLFRATHVFSATFAPF
jgi:hypothetical protein